MKLFGRVVLGLLGLLLLAGLLGAGWAWLENRPAEGSQTQRFHINARAPLSLTAQRLAEARLVRDPWVFRWLYQISEGEGTFPSGTFLVPGGLTAQEMAAFFRHAQPLQVKVTVPEGWTSTKIARLLEEKEVVSAQEFLAVVKHPETLGVLGRGITSLEGRLFPDTYEFPVGISAVDVAKVFVQTFQDRIAGWAANLPPDELNRRIILASIIEREYRDPEEAPLIASVFENRLNKGIALGSCATIEYILTEVLGRPHPSRILFVYTQIPSPYNTYLNRGLPPGPIANPGLTALKGAFEPANTTFLYFVVADAVKGTHTFSSNYSDHEKARQAYLSTFVTKG